MAGWFGVGDLVEWFGNHGHGGFQRGHRLRGLVLKIAQIREYDHAVEEAHLFCISDGQKHIIQTNRLTRLSVGKKNEKKV